MSFIIKLDSVIENDELPVLGALKIKVVDTYTSNYPQTNMIIIKAKNPVDLDIVGDGYFTDSTFTENNGQHAVVTQSNVWFSPGTYTILIKSKYDIEKLVSETSQHNFYFSIDELSYNEDLNDIRMFGSSELSGDIENLVRSASSMTALRVPNSKITGDIKNLQNMTGLTGLDFSNTAVTGALSALKGKTSLRTLNLDGSKIYGNISALQSAPLVNFSISNTEITGNISALAGKNITESIRINNSNVFGDIANLASATTSSIFANGLDGLTGDISQLNANTSFFGNAKASTSLYWGSRASNAYFIAMDGVNLGDTVDAMLINQANLAFSPSATSAWRKALNIVGNRTSASDSAVQTLKGRGVTINLNGIAL